MVKRLRKSVQYIQTYLTKSPNHNAFPSVSLFSAETTGPIFTKILRYSGINGAIKSCIYKALSHSVSECQSNESAEFVIFFTKLVAMAMSLEILEKEVQIIHLHPKCFHSVKRLRKSVQRILRQFVSEKSLKIKKEKRKHILSAISLLKITKIG